MSTAEIRNRLREEHNFTYRNEAELTLQFWNPVTYKDLKKIVVGVNECNIFIDNMEIYFDQIDGVYIPNILLAQNEELLLPTQKRIAELPKGELVASSEDIALYKQLSVHGEQIGIYDTVDAVKYSFAKGLFVINSEDYFRLFPHTMEKMTTLSLRLSSDNHTTYASYTKIRERLLKFFPKTEISVEEREQENDFLWMFISQEEISAFWIFLFALMNVINISYFWIMTRRREICIRKAFGMGNFQIAGMTAKNLMSLIMPISGLALFLQSVLWIFGGKMIAAADMLFVVLSILTAMILSCAVAMIVPLWIIFSIQPAEGVRL